MNSKHDCPLTHSQRQFSRFHTANRNQSLISGNCFASEDYSADLSMGHREFSLGSTLAFTDDLFFIEMKHSFSPSLVGRGMSMVASSHRADESEDLSATSQNRG
jgi:hypothetical protein